jgi:hypothetical protein
MLLPVIALGTLSDEDKMRYGCYSARFILLYIEDVRLIPGIFRRMIPEAITLPLLLDWRNPLSRYNIPGR